MGVMAFKESFRYIAYGEERRTSYVPMAFPCTHCNGTGIEPEAAVTEEAKEPYAVRVTFTTSEGRSVEMRVDCDRCSGTGLFVRDINCRHCGGTGKLEVNEADEGAYIVANDPITREGKVPTVREWKVKPPPPPDEPVDLMERLVLAKLKDSLDREYAVRVEWENGDSIIGIVESLCSVMEASVNAFLLKGRNVYYWLDGIIRVESSGRETEQSPAQNDPEEAILQKLQTAVEGGYKVRVGWESGSVETGLILKISDATFDMGYVSSVGSHSILGITSVKQIVETVADVSILEKLQDAVDGEYEVRVEWANGDQVIAVVTDILQGSSYEVDSILLKGRDAWYPIEGITSVEAMDAQGKASAYAEESKAHHQKMMDKLRDAIKGKYEVRIEFYSGWGRNGVIRHVDPNHFIMLPLIDRAEYDTPGVKSVECTGKPSALSCEGCIIKNANTTVTLDGMPPDMSLQAVMIYEAMHDGVTDLTRPVLSNLYLIGLIKGATGCDADWASHFGKAVMTVDEIKTALQALWLKVHSQPEAESKDHIPGEAVTFQEDSRTDAKVGG